MPAKPRRVTQLLQHDSALKPLYSEIQRQQQLLAQVRKSLPPSLAAHCCGARLDGSVLHLLTDTPVWVSKLRFQAPALLGTLRRRHPALASIKVRCDKPQRSAGRRRAVPRARHSNQAAKRVGESAEGISNPALRIALLRLARALREE